MHVLIRTSPKGEGQRFIGYCLNCHKQGLTITDMDERCPEESKRSFEESFMTVLDME